MRTSKKIYDEMVDSANKVRMELINRIDNDETGFLHFDTRDFTSKSIVYGIRKVPVFTRRGDADNINLGEFISMDVSIPKYKFFRFRDMYGILHDICDECGIGRYHVRNMEIKDVICPVIRVLSWNEKYYQTFYGEKAAYRVCIFIYGGPSTCRLHDLEVRFNERERKIAIAESEYRRKSEAAMWDRIERRLTR